MDFKGKVALITGGTGGIGQEFARVLLERKVKVAISDLDVTTGNKVLKSLQDDFGKNNVIFSKCDVTKESEFEETFRECEKKLGPVDILFNNAGIIHPDFKKTMDVNFNAVVLGTELALKRMSKENGGKGGNVVNTASILGLAVTPMFPYYVASKGAVVHYTRSAGHEVHFKYTGVCINCICPSFTETPLLTNTEKTYYYNDNIQKLTVETVRDIPKLRPRQIADAAIKLLEDGKPGVALAVERETKPYYVTPSLLKEF